MVTKYSKQVAFRLKKDIYKKLRKQAKKSGDTVSEFLRKVVTNLVIEFYPGDLPESKLEPLSDLTSDDLVKLDLIPEDLKYPPKVLAAKPIKQDKLKPVVMEIEHIEVLDNEEEKKPKGLWQRFTELMERQIKIF